jgi:hypothetical protein
MTTASSLMVRPSPVSAQSAETTGEVKQRRGQIGQEDIGSGIGQLSVDGDGFFERSETIYFSA